MIKGLAIATILKYAKGIAGGLVIAGLLWSIYLMAIRPHLITPQPTTTQSAESIVNHNYHNPRVIGGCLHIRAYERESYNKK